MDRPALTIYASISDYPLWIPDDLPEMLIGILKVAGVTAPEGVVSRLHDNGTSFLSMLHHRVDFGL